jgi:hypothetical protein
LAKDGLLTGVLVFHGAGRRLQVLEGFGNSLGRVRNHGFGVAIDLQQRTATGAWNFELGRRLSHARIVPQALETNHNRRKRPFPKVSEFSPQEFDFKDVTNSVAGNLMV